MNNCPQLVAHTMVVFCSSGIRSKQRLPKVRGTHFSIQLIIYMYFGRRMEKQHRGMCYDYRQLTDVLPTHHRVSANCRPPQTYRPSVRQLTTDKRWQTLTNAKKRPRGFSGSCSSHLPWILLVKLSKRVWMASFRFNIFIFPSIFQPTSSSHQLLRLTMFVISWYILLDTLSPIGTNCKYWSQKYTDLIFDNLLSILFFR